jgi:hypothetical protein
MAGQVLSRSWIEPRRTAWLKRGPTPISLMTTAPHSTVLTHPAPTSRSACNPQTGAHSRCRSLTPRRISARVAAMAGPLSSFGIASIVPDSIAATSSSTDTKGCLRSIEFSFSRARPRPRA